MEGSSTSTLSQRVVRGGLWMLGLRVANRGLGFVRILILARLLLPEDFGLIGIALLATNILDTFSATGFSSALIQRGQAGEELWDTTWLFSLVRGFLLGAIVFAAAPWVAEFFGRPDALWIIRAIGLTLLLRGLTNPSVVGYIKEMSFQRQFGYEIGITVVDAAVAIPLALIYRSVWALAMGGLAGQAAGVVLSWLIHPMRVRLRFDRRAFRELYGFGRWITASNIFNFLLTQGDDILVGRLLGAPALGWYQMAYRVSNLPATEIASVISQVTFPAYAQLQESRARVGAAFLRVIRMSTLLSFPIGALVILLGPDFTRVILGPHWVPMISTMQILAIYGLIHSLGASCGPVFLGLGRANLTAKIQLVKLVIFAATVYPLTKTWGLLGTAGAVAGNAILVNPVADYLVMREVRGRFLDFLLTLWPPFLISLGMALLVGVVLTWMEGGWPRLVMGGIVAVIAYLLGIYLFEIRGRLGLMTEVQTIWREKISHGS